MCGICGKLSWDTPPDRELVQRMNERIAHRGPDAERVTVIGPVVLGHRRLAIIDLSPAGIQPMPDVSRNYWIVFNGEMYNFQEVRRELETGGARFHSNSDTEVILEAYKRWGVDCLQRFNGMFAFVLWDAPARRLFLARDRLGKKPLFYQMLPDGGIVFASELKALCLDPSVSRRINPRALNQYLSLNYTLTSETMLEGVRKLPAAHYLVVEQGKPIRETSYWDLASCFHQKNRFRSEDEAAEALRALIDDSVRLRLISDVPLGVFLSGGVDSSTIVAAMCQIGEPGDVHSFSVGFEEKGYSELDEARQVANLFGVHHRESIVLPDTAQLLPRIVYHADEPFADTSIFPMFLLAEFCRKYVTVCLSGDGGDEVFAGYETYTADKIHHWTRWIPRWASRLLYRAVNRWFPVTYGKVSFDYKLRQFLEGHAFDGPRAHYHWREIFSNSEKRDLLNPALRTLVNDDTYEYFHKQHQQVAKCHYLDQGMYMDIKTWLVDDILVKVDRMTMAHALESRAPLLDFRVVEFAASLPVDLKMKFLKKKYLLKKSQNQRIPRSVLQRSKKGFNAPVSHWLASSLRDQFHELTTESPLARAYFNKPVVDCLWQEHEGRVQDHSLKLLGLASFLLWCEQFEASLDY
jgi:asparagine synthase (glutamine-hydrolysing)